MRVEFERPITPPLGSYPEAFENVARDVDSARLGEIQRITDDLLRRREVSEADDVLGTLTVYCPYCC